MKSRTLGIAIACLVLALVGITMGCATTDTDLAELHDAALVWDTHNDLAYRVLYELLDIGERLPGGHVDIPRLQEGGVDVQGVALYVENFLYEIPGQCSRQAHELLTAMRNAIDSHAEDVELARTAADIERIVASGKIAMPIAIEGGHAIEASLDKLREFYELGVSSMTLTHNVSHDWADAGADDPKWGGLNDLGRDVVREMNNLGMVIDISHVSDSTFFDVMETTEDPVIASHSGCRALNPHHRNMSDDQLRALGENGGVIGIVFVLNYLTPEYLEAMNELTAVGRDAFLRVPEIEDIDLRIAVNHLNASRDWPLDNHPTIEDVLDHIDHAVQLAGVDHVGLGADMYPRTPSPVGIRGVQDYPNITRGLKERGYSDEDVRKILGGNFMRVWKEVTDGG